jgi:putative peptidoglycan lipid II flippase
MTKAPSDGDSSLGRASLFLASGTVVSRILGFISAIILARTLGIVGSGADTFALANQLPNNIYAIVAGGVLSAVLVPHIVKAGLDRDGGQAFINKIITLGFVIFLAVAILATLLAPALVALYAQQGGVGSRGFSPDEMALAIAFAYWCLPQILFYALYSLLSEVLNARKVFGPFTWAPALNNIVAMTGLVVFGVLFPGPDTANAKEWTSEMVAVLAGSATLGVAAQAFILLAFWRRAGLGFRPDFQWRGVGLAATGRAASWMFGMIVVAQIAGIVQANVASLAAGSGAPGLAVLRFSWLIFMLPHSVVAVSLATAYFTRMSTHARDGDVDAVRSDFRDSVSRIGLFMVLASVGLIVVALPFARQFGVTFEAIAAMSTVIVLYVLGLVPFSVLFVIQRVFYALEDTRTPFFIQLAQATVFVGLALAVSALDAGRIAFGIALATTIAGWFQCLLALVLLRKKLGGLMVGSILGRYGVYFLAAIPAAAAGVGILIALGGGDPNGFLLSSAVSAGLGMAVITVVMTLVYSMVLVLMRNSDMLAVWQPLRRRLPFTRGGNTSA